MTYEDPIMSAEHKPSDKTEDAASTGEFLPTSPPPADHKDATDILPSPSSDSAATEAGGTGVYLPNAEPRHSASSATEGTGIYEPPGTSATGEYSPGSTQDPVELSTQSPESIHERATGEFISRDNGAPATDLAGATGEFTPSGAPLIWDKQLGASIPVASKCGRYVLKRFHAKGGMGEIWLAVDPAIGRSVALKRMLGRRPDQQHRFRVEAQVTGQLEHPGIVPVHELGTNEQGLPFYAMKFVHGRTLQKVIKEYHKTKTNSTDRDVEQFKLLQIFISLCQTVAYAHSRGVLHRDLKPENVMLGPYGETLLLDWGIAKVIGQPEATATDTEAEFVHLQENGQDTETQAGSVMGSPSYMSPETAQGLNEQIDKQSDVYLLGATLYEILTGHPPRMAKSAFDMIMMAQREHPEPARKKNPHVSKALDAICMKAMAFRKQDRYQTALELAEDVQRYVAGEPVSAFREGVAARAWRWAKRHRKALIRTSGALLLVGLCAFGYSKFHEAQLQKEKEIRENNERNAAKLREAEESKLDAQRKAERSKALVERAKALDDARIELKQFRRLADEARFYAATTDPVSENSPYFDPREGEIRIRNALKLSENWVPVVEKLALTEEVDSVKKELTGDRDSVKKERYDLLLLLAQNLAQRGATDKTARETLVLLEEAGLLRPPSRSYFRLRADAFQRLGDEQKAARDRVRAEEAGTPVASLDQFLLGEQYRREAVDKASGQQKKKVTRGDETLTNLALDAYREALRIDPNHYWSQLQLGRCHLSMAHYAEAVEALGACVALAPESPWGYSVRGAALVLLKKYDKAEHDLNKAVALSPLSRAPLLNRGVVYMHQMKTKEALADFAAVLDEPKEKRLIEAAYYRGQLYLQQPEVKKALADFEMVVAENPSFLPVYPYLAQVQATQGNHPRALAALDALLTDGATYDPKSWQAQAQRGQTLRYLFAGLPLDVRQKPSGQALAILALNELNDAVKKGAKSPEVFADLGSMLEFTDETKAATDAYGQGLELSALSTLGTCTVPSPLGSAPLFTASALFADRSLRANLDLRMLIQRAWAFDLLKQRDKAREDFAAALRVDPDNAEAHSGLGYMRALEKLPTEAQREADLALLHGGDNYMILHNVACIYVSLSLLEEGQARAHQDVALALLRRAVKLWKLAGSGLNEIDLIKNDPTFNPLKPRREYQELIMKSEH